MERPKRNKMGNNNIYADGIRKTGFVLENQISNILKSQGWSVISNKYYEDDLEGSIREMDILAYKVAVIEEVSVYTSLLISCKKNEENIWALLSREINLNDKNTNWIPLHLWTNNKAIQFEINKPTFNTTYHEKMKELGVTEALAMPSVEVFAFQEMNKISGKPQNDKNIFNSLTSLMKAQSYELNALSDRKKTPSIYQFNLLSLIDSDLFRLMFDADEIKQAPVSSEHYVSRYIINKKEMFFRIRFVQATKFLTILADYNRLHDANCKFVKKSIISFYKDVLKDYSKSNMLLAEFQEALGWTLHMHRHLIPNNGPVKILGIHLIETEKVVQIIVNQSEAYAEYLNKNVFLKAKTITALSTNFRYSGKFKWASNDELPF